jgi:hypothetical protein
MTPRCGDPPCHPSGQPWGRLLVQGIRARDPLARPRRAPREQVFVHRRAPRARSMDSARRAPVDSRSGRAPRPTRKVEASARTSRAKPRGALRAGEGHPAETALGVQEELFQNRAQDRGQAQEAEQRISGSPVRAGHRTQAADEAAAWRSRSGGIAIAAPVHRDGDRVLPGQSRLSRGDVTGRQGLSMGPDAAAGPVPTRLRPARSPDARRAPGAGSGAARRPRGPVRVSSAPWSRAAWSG